MLRRLDIRDQWRSLDPGFWPEDQPAGCRTVVYGHNGSGKSTLSELLLSLSDGGCAADVILEDEGRNRIAVAEGSLGGPSIAVFTRKWVEANLSDFLDGDSASAIVTLGREAIDAKEEEARLAGEIESLRQEAADAEKRGKAADRKLDTLIRGVQDRIVSELKEFDYNYYTKNRFSVTRVQEDLRKYKGECPDSNAHAEALKRLGEGVPSPVPELLAPPPGLAKRLVDLTEVLTDTPTRVALDALEQDPRAQTWVEQGLGLHSDRSECLFCASAISAERRDHLARHFDESWHRIRNIARDLRDAVAAERKILASWAAALPSPERLTGDIRPTYEAALGQATTEVELRVAAMNMVEEALNAKINDPTAILEAPDWSRLASPLSAAVLSQAVAEHNDEARKHDEVISQRKQIVLDHLVGSQSAAFRELENQAQESSSRRATSRKAVELAEGRLARVREERFTTKKMADTLTRDLARVYGKDHLSVAVTAGGKSYSCKRGDKPATDLSDGERTTLSLLYFLRKLEDEQIPGGDPAARLVVVDDPSSSLDRESLFATHQWLIDTLTEFGQYIVLTHDFSLLRLFLKSQRSAWGSSMKRIKQGDEEEIRFPKVSFLEMYAVTQEGERRSRLGKLPRLLLDSTSEYAYLFAMVMTGVADSEDHERLFLLPNAARRVLEVFASYKAPHRSDFRQQLEVLVEGPDGEPFRDVYDFCNRFSHGEGSESVDVLDARAVHGQIRRSMEFLRAIDGEHFERMCQATGVDPSVLG